MRREAVIRTLLFFLPTLVFIIALTSPGGDYAFRSGPLAEVALGQLPSYVAAEDKTLYLYSSPYGPWLYPKAVEVRLFYPTTVLASSTCGAVGVSSVGEAPGAYPVDLTIPPGFEGECLVNFTHPSGWRDAVRLKVRLVDWYPGSAQRVVITLNGSGWQFVQVGRDGAFYIWERDVGKLPISGCVFVFNKSVLITETLKYAEVVPNVLPPVYAPSDKGVERYGAFVKLQGVEKLYVYDAPCPPAVNVSVPPAPTLRGEMGVVLPGYAGPFFDSPRAEGVRVFKTALREVNYTVATAKSYRVHFYTYSTPVGMWGAVIRYQFDVSTYLTTLVSLYKPLNATGPFRQGVAWLYTDGMSKYWVFSRSSPYYTCNPPCGVPSGWTEPIYVVADPTGTWGGWPAVISVVQESLRPWKT